jgi:hypothetical protein
MKGKRQEIIDGTISGQFVVERDQEKVLNASAGQRKRDVDQRVSARVHRGFAQSELIILLLSTGTNVTYLSK